MRASRLLVLSVLAACATSCAAQRFKVQVVETSSMSSNANGMLHANVFAKVILPNGDHASLLCGNKRCALIKPIAPEKMNPNATECSHLGNQFNCTTHDLGEYWATRKGNWLTIEAPNGKLTFEITGSW